MTQKYLKTLEFDKIIAKAAAHAVCEEAKAQILLLEPLNISDEVRYALSQTNEVTTLLIKNGKARFYKVSGVDKIVNRAAKGGILSMSELLQFANALRNFRTLTEWYSITEHEMLSTDEYFYALSPQPQIEKRIFEAILSDTEMADTASDVLYEIRRKIRVAENSIRDKLDSIVKSSTTSKYLQETVVSLRNGRFVVPVKAEHKGDLGGIIHDVSQSGSTFFVEPTAVVEANAKIMQLHSQEQAEIERILAAFSQQAADMEQPFLYSYSAMISIDVLMAKAALALDQNASMPSVNDNGCFSLVRARHPLIDKSKVVAVDIVLGQKADTMIITGPNTGGKTVTLKTAGLLCAMAQHGLLLPAHESSSICVFSDILVDIGDEQSIEQSLSTFSGHIKNITEILRLANKSTMVLMDELGAGTDPAEGAALAIAVIETLRKAKTLVMATTHYAELKVFALETKGVENASCEFDVETLRPTYKLSVGVPGKSNAFLISSKLGVPAGVLSLAAQHLNEQDKQFDSVLSQLDELKLQLKAGQDEINYLKNIAEKELELAQKKREEIIAQGEKELVIAQEKAKSITEAVQNEAYRLLDELKMLEKDSKQAAQQRAIRAREIAKKDTERLLCKTDVVYNAPKQFIPLKEVKIGQEVELTEIGTTGIVLSLPDKNGFVQVRAGVIKTKALLSSLAQPNKQQPKPKQLLRKPSTFDAAVKRTVSMELNMLGMNVDEAIMEADRFIDGAVMNGQGMVYLIHGKGTGALRSGIHAHLRGHKNVRTFRLGTYGEGESGVTVVELK